MMNERKKMIKDPFLAIFLYFGLSITLSIVISILIKYFSIKNALLTNFLMIIATFIPTIVIIYNARLRLKGQFELFKKNILGNLKEIAKSWLIGFFLMCFVNIIINSITTGLAPNEEANRQLIDTLPLCSIVSACLLGPISEEILFRLNFKEFFKDELIFTLTTGLLFGFMHVLNSELNLTNLIYILPYSILGIAFSHVYAKTGTIYSSIFMHMFHNILSISLILAA